MLVGDDRRITIVNETFEYRDLLTFKAGCDCYVSLHRSEGWGFGMIESMALGVPVIATGYSGNLEFCNDKNSWLVESDEVFVGKKDYIFVVPGQKWAEPRMESAINAMREVYYDPKKRNSKSVSAKKYVHDNFSVDKIASRYSARINEILK